MTRGQENTPIICILRKVKEIGIERGEGRDGANKAVRAAVMKDVDSYSVAQRAWLGGEVRLAWAERTASTCAGPSRPCRALLIPVKLMTPAKSQMRSSPSLC